MIGMLSLGGENSIGNVLISVRIYQKYSKIASRTKEKIDKRSG